MKNLTIQEQVDVLKNTLKNQASKDPSFTEFYDTNWQTVDSMLTAIVDASNKSKRNSVKLRNNEQLKFEIRKALSEVGLTFRGAFEFNSVLFIDQYEDLYFEFERLSSNEIKVKCKFSELDIDRSYCKYFDDTTYVEVGFNDSWASMDVIVVSSVETTLENLADDLLPLISKVINLAKPFDTKGKLDNFELT